MMIYSLEAEKTNGTKVPLANYQGKVMLIVNTASKCHFTPQFEDLQKLYLQYRDQGLEILGFPCNQFGEQEPGTNEEAAGFCKMNYGVTFPIFAKSDVNGDGANPIFKYLKDQVPFRGFNEDNISEKLLKMMISDKGPEWLIGEHIKWNFTKFLIDQEGKVIKRFEPTDGIDEIAENINKLLLASKPI